MTGMGNMSTWKYIIKHNGSQHQNSHHRMQINANQQKFIVIIPYRDRAKHLALLLGHIRLHLLRQVPFL